MIDNNFEYDMHQGHYLRSATLFLEKAGNLTHRKSMKCINLFASTHSTSSMKSFILFVTLCLAVGTVHYPLIFYQVGMTSLNLNFKFAVFLQPVCKGRPTVVFSTCLS